MQNLIVVFTFFCFRRKTPFLCKFGEKKNCQLKLKFVNWANSNMQNSMVVFTFSALDWKHPFQSNSIQKIKIVSLS